MDIQICGPSLNMSEACEPILRALPEWFGIESSITKYIEDIKNLPTLTAVLEGTTIGFITVKTHNQFSAEIHVMGVDPKYHRMGIGKSLIKRAEKDLMEEGVEYLQVKTLSASHPDKGYAMTRDFYTKMGFRPLEEFKEMWDINNPCILMVKKIEQ